MRHFKHFAAAARVIALVALGAVLVEAVPTLARHAAGHPTTYAAGSPTTGRVQ